MATRPQAVSSSPTHFEAPGRAVKKTAEPAGVLEAAAGIDVDPAHGGTGRVRSVVGPEVAELSLGGVDDAVAAEVGVLAGQRAGIGIGGRGVGDAVRRTVVALLGAVGDSVAAVRSVLARHRAAAVGGVVVVHAGAGGIRRRDAGVAAIALLCPGRDAVAAGGPAVRLVGGEAAERELEVRLRRSAVPAEHRD